ncbi:MAG: response regulator [Silicimonas sp.]|nr:response regulator [Silicimonas sp.]
MSYYHKKDMEQQREEQEEPLLLASKLINLGYYIWDMENDEPIEVSDQHLKTYGVTREEFLAKASTAGGSFEMVHPDDRAKVDAWCRKLEDGKIVEMEYRILNPNGTRWIRAIVRPYLDDAGKLVKQICASLDITAQKSTEEFLIRSQTLESVGRLTAGIAHDFNNILAVILGNLELMAELREKEDVTAMSEAAIGATLRGKNLTEKLLTFGRKTKLNPVIIDGNSVIRDLGEVFHRTIPATIEVETVLAGGLWAIEVDVTQFENALLNLVINARDAMPDGGTLTIESANVRLDDAYSDEYGGEIDPGRYVLVAVSDTGQGIPESDLEHLFEPFFTTKEVGKGTGLGLALVYGFLKQSGGVVQVYSEVGEGTTVKMYFPSKGRLAKALTRPTQEPSREIAEVGRALVVDDDPEVRKVVALQLTSLGFEVYDAENGKSALELLETVSDIQLLLTDLVMPGDLQGSDLAKIAAEKSPKTKIILMTGYAKSAAENGNGDCHSFTKLMKPVQINDLKRAVARVLSEG